MRPFARESLDGEVSELYYSGLVRSDRSVLEVRILLHVRVRENVVLLECGFSHALDNLRGKDAIAILVCRVVRHSAPYLVIVPDRDVLVHGLQVTAVEEGLESQRIAWIAGYFTRTLKRTLMKAGLHRVGEEVQFGSESAPGSIVQPDSNEIILVSVSVPFYFQNSWSVEPIDKLLLKRVELALQYGEEAPSSVQINPPSIYGKVLATDNVLPLTMRVSAGQFKSPKPRKL